MDLPQPLVVRVMRADGTGIPDYPVEWTLRRGAHDVKFAGHTDRHGFARAVWILANTTARQTAEARVAGLPPVTFAASAQLRTVSNERLAQQRRVAPGVVVLDASGEVTPPLLRATPQLRSQKLDSVSALLQPIVRGTIIAANGGDAPVRIIVQSRTARDSVDVAAGAFAWPLRGFQRNDAVDVRVQPLDEAAQQFYPALLRARAGNLDSLRLSLVPRTWVISSGEFRGLKVPIHMSRAFAQACAKCASFYRRTAADSAGDWRATGESWPNEALPLSVDFASGSDRLSAADSVAFWMFVARLEKTLGRNVLRRETSSPERSMLQIGLDAGQEKLAETSTASQSSRIFTAQITFKRNGLIAGQLGTYLVQHELMHVIGFGHTCAWHSVLADARHCASLQSDVVTAEDVAYMELFLAVRAAESTGAALSLEGAARAESRRN